MTLIADRVGMATQGHPMPYCGLQLHKARSCLFLHTTESPVSGIVPHPCRVLSAQLHMKKCHGEWSALKLPVFRVSKQTLQSKSYCPQIGCKVKFFKIRET